MSEDHEEFRNLKTEMLKINTARGGGASGLKGFYAECVNASYDNLERIESGTKARQIVIDNNGDADAIIKYTNGQFGRAIQYKNGYSYSKHKEFVTSGKYDNMSYVINADNPIFDNPEQIENLNTLAKAHNIKLFRAKVTDKEMQILAGAACFEGKIKKSLEIDTSPRITLELYVDAKEVEYHFNKVIERQASFNSYIANQTSAFLNGDMARINSVGVNQALSAAQFAAALSVTENVLSVIKGEKEFKDTTINVIENISKAAVMGYATGVMSDVLVTKTGATPLLVNGAIQISKQLSAYMNGEIDEDHFVRTVIENSVNLTAVYLGKTFGGAICSVAGPAGIFVGQFIGEMLTTTFCSVIIDAIRTERNTNAYHNKLLALAYRAESEIRESQDRLIILVNNDNNRFIDLLNTGYDEFIDGILTNDYKVATAGLFSIGEGFGIEAEKLTRGHVTQGSIFINKDRIVSIG